MNRALTQTVGAKETPQLSHGGSSLKQTSDTDPPIKDLSPDSYKLLRSASGNTKSLVLPLYESLTPQKQSC